MSPIFMQPQSNENKKKHQHQKCQLAVCTLAFVSISVFVRKQWNSENNSNLQSMSINNWFPLEAPPKPYRQCSLLYHELCKVCLSLYITTAEIYCGHVRWCSFDFLSVSLTFMHNCWWWPAAHMLGHDSSCTTPRRHRACPASAGRQHRKERKDIIQIINLQQTWQINNSMRCNHWMEMFWMRRASHYGKSFC